MKVTHLGYFSRLLDIENELRASLKAFVIKIGTFGTTGAHCFNPSSPAYIRIAALIEVRTCRNQIVRLRAVVVKLTDRRFWQAGRKCVRHHPALPFDEIAAFMAELRARDGVSARALEVTILTALRTGEVIKVQWDEIDLVNKVWDCSRCPHESQERAPPSPI